MKKVNRIITAIFFVLIFTSPTKADKFFDVEEYKEEMKNTTDGNVLATFKRSIEPLPGRGVSGGGSNAEKITVIVAEIKTRKLESKIDNFPQKVWQGISRGLKKAEKNGYTFTNGTTWLFYSDFGAELVQLEGVKPEKGLNLDSILKEIGKDNPTVLDMFTPKKMFLVHLLCEYARRPEWVSLDTFDFHGVPVKNFTAEQAKAWVDFYDANKPKKGSKWTLHLSLLRRLRSEISSREDFIKRIKEIDSGNKKKLEWKTSISRQVRARKINVDFFSTCKLVNSHLANTFLIPYIERLDVSDAKSIVPVYLDLIHLCIKEKGGLTPENGITISKHLGKVGFFAVRPTLEAFKAKRLGLEETSVVIYTALGVKEAEIYLEGCHVLEKDSAMQKSLKNILERVKQLEIEAIEKVKKDKEEAERKAKEEAERKAEAKRKAKEEAKRKAEAKAKEKAEEKAEAKRKAEEEAKLEAELEKEYNEEFSNSSGTISVNILGYGDEGTSGKEIPISAALDIKKGETQPRYKVYLETKGFESDNIDLDYKAFRIRTIGEIKLYTTKTSTEPAPLSYSANDLLNGKYIWIEATIKGGGAGVVVLEYKDQHGSIIIKDKLWVDFW